MLANKSPTAVGTGRSAVAVHVVSRRWFRLLQLGHLCRLLKIYVPKSGGCHFVADMVWAFTIPAVSACEERIERPSAGAGFADHVWIHRDSVAAGFIARPALVFLDIYRGYFIRPAHGAGGSRAAHLALAAGGSGRRSDNILCADNRSILVVASMKPWPDTCDGRVRILTAQWIIMV